MAIGREAIYDAIYAQLRGTLITPTGPFTFSGRRIVPFGGLPLAQYPAFFLVEKAEHYSRHLYVPTRVTIQAQLVLQSVDGATPTMNTLADAVEDAINGPAGATAQNTLGGIVQQCWLNGRHVVVTAATPQPYTEQTFELEMVLPHSR